MQDLLHIHALLQGGRHAIFAQKHAITTQAGMLLAVSTDFARISFPKLPLAGTATWQKKKLLCLNFLSQQNCYLLHVHNAATLETETMGNSAKIEHQQLALCSCAVSAQITSLLTSFLLSQALLPSLLPKSYAPLREFSRVPFQEIEAFLPWAMNQNAVSSYSVGRNIGAFH